MAQNGVEKWIYNDEYINEKIGKMINDAKENGLPDITFPEMGCKGTLDYEKLLQIKNCLANYPTLKRLCISGHDFSKANLDPIKDLVKFLPNLVDLSLTYNNMTLESIVSIMVNVETEDPINVELGGNNWDEAKIRKFCNILETGYGLEQDSFRSFIKIQRITFDDPRVTPEWQNMVTNALDTGLNKVNDIPHKRGKAAPENYNDDGHSQQMLHNYEDNTVEPFYNSEEESDLAHPVYNCDDDESLDTPIAQPALDKNMLMVPERVEKWEDDLNSLPLETIEQILFEHGLSGPAGDIHKSLTASGFATVAYVHQIIALLTGNQKELKIAEKFYKKAEKQALRNIKRKKNVKKARATLRIARYNLAQLKLVKKMSIDGALQAMKLFKQNKGCLFSEFMVLFLKVQYKESNPEKKLAHMSRMRAIGEEIEEYQTLIKILTYYCHKTNQQILSNDSDALKWFRAINETELLTMKQDHVEKRRTVKTCSHKDMCPRSNTYRRTNCGCPYVLEVYMADEDRTGHRKLRNSQCDEFENRKIDVDAILKRELERAANIKKEKDDEEARKEQYKSTALKILKGIGIGLLLTLMAIGYVLYFVLIVLAALGGGGSHY